MPFSGHDEPVPAAPADALGVAHRRRLLAIWRSAGWPCHDPIELDLLAAGCLARSHDSAGRETLRVTDAGIARLAAARRAHQGARSPHESLVDRIAEQLGREGRWAWRGLALWAMVPIAVEAEDPAVQLSGELFAHHELPSELSEPLGQPAGRTSRGAWVRTLPDLFSIRPSSRADRLEPEVHEIKVQRGDLLSDLRRPAKGAAYLSLAGACTYVMAEGIGTADEVPEPFGVMLARPQGIELVRAPLRRSAALVLPTWLALARATPCAATDEPWQWPLTVAPDAPDDASVRSV